MQVSETSSPPGTRRPWWLVGLFIAIFSFFTDDYIIAGILPEVADDLGVSEAIAGQLVTVFSLTVAIATPLSSFLFSRVNRKKLVSVAITAFVAANIGATIADDYGVMVLLRVLAALSAASAIPVIFAAAAELSPDDRRGRYLGFLSVAVTGSVAVGVAGGVWIADRWSWHHTFALMAISGGIALVFVLVTFPEVREQPAISLREQLKVISSREISAALIGGGVAIFGSMMVLTYIAPYLQEVLGRGDARGIVLAVFGVTATFGVFGGGWAVDKFGANKTLFGGMLAYILLMLIIAVVSMAKPVSLAAFFPLVVVWGLLAYSSSTAVQVRLHALAGPLTAQALALNSSLGTLGVAISAAVGGVVISAGAVLFIPVIAAVSCSLGLLLLLAAFRNVPIGAVGSKGHV